MFFFQAEDGIRDLVRSRGLGDVYKRQAIIPTGSELVPVDAGEPPPGHIIEYNSLVLAAQVESWGGVPTRRLLYNSDAADARSSGDLGGRRILRKIIKPQIRARHITEQRKS